MDERGRLSVMDGELQAWLSYGVGLQISAGVDDEVPLLGSWGDVGHRRGDGCHGRIQRRYGQYPAGCDAREDHRGHSHGRRADAEARGHGRT